MKVTLEAVNSESPRVSPDCKRSLTVLAVGLADVSNAALMGAETKVGTSVLPDERVVVCCVCCDFVHV